MALVNSINTDRGGLTGLTTTPQAYAAPSAALPGAYGSYQPSMPSEAVRTAYDPYSYGETRHGEYELPASMALSQSIPRLENYANYADYITDLQYAVSTGKKRYEPAPVSGAFASADEEAYANAMHDSLLQHYKETDRSRWATLRDTSLDVIKTNPVIGGLVGMGIGGALSAGYSSLTGAAGAGTGATAIPGAFPGGGVASAAGTAAGGGSVGLGMTGAGGGMIGAGAAGTTAIPSAFPSGGVPSGAGTAAGGGSANLGGGTIMGLDKSQIAKLALTAGAKLADSGAPAAASSAAGTQAGYEQQALDYLRERDALPSQLSEEALSKLGGIYGLEGGTGSAEAFIASLEQNPLYQSIIGTQAAGEEAILRHAGATGGLRSGNVQAALATHASDLERQALMETYGQQIGGLTGMAGLPSYAPQIAGGMTDIGSTLAAGELAESRAEQEERAQLIGLAGTAYKELGGYEGISEIGSNIYNWFV